MGVLHQDFRFLNFLLCLFEGNLKKIYMYPV
jgi:hypothetical protein